MRTTLSLLIHENANRLRAREPERDIAGCDDCRLAELWLWLDEQQSKQLSPGREQVQL
ncbi:hypothetical protein [Zobellella maritima]|uniref:hypothetical protein n=1 Tax=Zobellella maritima TaxID=2059725 RepID=UPI001300414F|nr:hypothetical protein [Zobellella maritima]